MGEIERYRERVEASLRDLAALQPAGWHDLGPPDPETGERWDGRNVLGHMAEMLPYRTGQVRAVLGGATWLGRDEDGYRQRRTAIDRGREAGEEELLMGAGAGVTGLLGLLADVRDEDLDRRLSYRSRHGEQEVELRYVVEELLVGHVEAHLAQLRELA